MNGPTRLFLYPRDIANLNGWSYNYAYRVYRTLVDSLGKEKGKRITIPEYCKLEDVKEDEVRRALCIN